MDSIGKSTAQRSRGTLESDRALRATLVGFGLLTLCVFVLVGAILQPGVVQCAICDGSTCGPGITPYCPNTGPVLAVILGALAIGAVLVAVGLSPRAARSLFSTRGLRPSAGGVRPPSGPGKFLALFLLFFGSGVTSLGLLLPLPNFGECHEACVYSYALQGIPLVLFFAGISAIIVGTVLLSRSVTLRRSGPARERSSSRIGRDAD